jgi:hypothetical protein
MVRDPAAACLRSSAAPGPLTDRLSLSRLCRADRGSLHSHCSSRGGWTGGRRFDVSAPFAPRRSPFRSGLPRSGRQDRRLHPLHRPSKRLVRLRNPVQGRHVSLHRAVTESPIPYALSEEQWRGPRDRSRLWDHAMTHRPLNKAPHLQGWVLEPKWTSYSEVSRARTCFKRRSISADRFLNQSVDQIRWIAHPWLTNVI